MEAIKQKYIEAYLTTQYRKAKFNGSLSLGFDPEWEAKQNELWIVNRFNYLQLESIRVGLTPVFLTLTLPSEYHQFKQVNKNNKDLIFNPLFSGVSVEKSVAYLNIIFRHLINNFSAWNSESERMKKEEIKFSRVIEPHKDFTPHLHAIVYVKDAKQFKHHFDNTVAKFKLEQVDYEVLDKANYSIAYLLKYVAKSIRGTNAIIQGWKQTHKIVQVRTSNMPFTRVQYTAFTRAVKYNPKYTNIFYQMAEEGLFFVHTIEIDKIKLDEYGYKGKTRILEDFLEDFQTETKGNELLPTFVMHEYRVKTHLENFVEVEEYDPYDTMHIQVPNLDDFWDIPIADYDASLDLYVPVSSYSYLEECYDSIFYFYGYNRRLTYRKVITLQDVVC